MLSLAVVYGWEPAGTSPPEGVLPRAWSGTYDTNDGALFSREDARQFAAALERFLNAAPRSNKCDVQPFVAWLADEGRDVLIDFVSFLRGGSFRLN